MSKSDTDPEHFDVFSYITEWVFLQCINLCIICPGDIWENEALSFTGGVVATAFINFLNTRT